MKKILGLLFLLFTAIQTFEAQTTGSALGRGFLSLHAHDSNIIAVIDSNITRVLPLDSLSLPEGNHHIIVMREREWNGMLADTTVTLEPRQAVILDVPEKYEYTILSSPPEAAITIGRTKTGETPFQFTTTRTMSAPVTISAMGYEPLTLEAPLQSINVVHLREEGELAPPLILPNTYIRDEGTAVYVSLTAAVVAGTISAIAKRRADGFSDTYSATGEASARASAKRYDVIAGVSLFVTEVSFGALTYYLLLQ
ncbi:MAG: PEGA domain-containing protein [Bacteroidota bacterium]|nr:PEGA domain-containing protein [Bacteroidota bacterium]